MRYVLLAARQALPHAYSPAHAASSDLWVQLIGLWVREEVL